MANYHITEFGARGDGVTDDASAIQTAIDRCSASGGGRVVVPAGLVFLAGPFDMKSNVLSSTVSFMLFRIFSIRSKSDFSRRLNCSKYSLLSISLSVN